SDLGCASATAAQTTGSSTTSWSTVSRCAERGARPATWHTSITTRGIIAIDRKYGSTMPQYMSATGKAPVTPASTPAVIHPTGPAVVQVRISAISASGHSTAASSSITTLEASGIP